MRGCSVAVDRRLSGRRFPRVPRTAPGQQSLFEDSEAPPVNENAWKLTEAHRQAGRAGVAQARETLTRSPEETAYLARVHDQIFGSPYSAGDPDGH